MPKPKQIAEQLAVDFRADLIAGGKPDIVTMLTKAIEEFKKQEPEVVQCPDHPRYKGARIPKNSCEHCWRLYLRRKNT